jgi:putative membrane-bound dehydrogenase-like protein
MKLAFTFVCSMAFLGVAQSHAAGRQLTGVYSPASTPPLAPEEAAKKFTVPEGFEMRIFASEPQVVNPVAMTWDDRGRLWVVELYEYPLGAAPGTKPRDQVKILEDTDNDGRADKVTIFKDGLNLATGLQLGYGGVFVGQAPHLLFLEDTDGDDHADKQTILKTGFGLEDRHELLNGFTWGPDGYLYMTHGVFTQSKVKNPLEPQNEAVLLTAGVARFHPRSKKFEVFAEGTSNPWGVDFDRAGNAYVSACVIEHLFHLAPGGLYQRQAGNPPFPYAYGLLPSINDHKHFRAAYAGVQVYQGDQFPDEYKGTIFMGNIHDSSVHQDKLVPNGSTFKASFVRDLIRSNDGWFRPVSSQVGPDGALWVMDWYDKYPCYQNANADPEGVDRERGRIWRLVYTGKEKGKLVASHPSNLNLGKATTSDLVRALAHPNIWQRRMALRLLNERRDARAETPLRDLFQNGPTMEARLFALWALHGSGLLDDQSLDKAAGDKEPAIRAWAARLTGERGNANEADHALLLKLADDEDASVRLAVVTAVRQFTSGSLTVDTPPKSESETMGEVLAKVVLHPQSAEDPVIPFMIWMAAEPKVAKVPEEALNWLRDNGMQSPKLCSELTRKTMRRISDSSNNEFLAQALHFLDELPQEAAPLTIGALTGLIEGQKGRATAPDSSSITVLAKLTRSANKEIQSRAQQLGTIWGDSAAIQASVDLLKNPAKPNEERIAAIQAVRGQKIPAVRDALLTLLTKETPEKVQQTAIQSLAENGSDETGDKILDRWKSFSPATRRLAAGVLASRGHWAQQLISAIEKKNIGVDEIPTPVVRSLTGTKDDYIRNRALAVIGRYRESNPDKLKLIAEKRKIVLNGPIDLQKGHEIAQRTCFTCHKLHGEGADVGPDLTGVGRSSLDALLANVIDPNQIIGKGYENVEVETKDGRSISGRLVEDTDARLRLLAAGPKEEIVAKKEIASMRVSEMSVMPEGLEQMPNEDFRNLIWYIYSPPQDKKAVSVEEERKSILNAAAPSDNKPQASTFDLESVSLWNPEWRRQMALVQESSAKDYNP